MQKKIKYWFHGVLIFLILVGMLAFPVGVVHAAPILTIKPITWNVIGLDSNNVSVGPNRFPVGARVCNVGDTQALNVGSQFVWGADNTPAKNYIASRPGSISSYSGYTLNAGACVDFYYEVEVTRDSNAYDDTRQYAITASATGLSTISTPSNREIYVEHLISQNRNAIDNVYYGSVGQPIGSMTSVNAGGTMQLFVGQTYDIVLDAHTATQGYNQLESFINFPNTIFQIEKIQTTYTANSSTFVLNTNDLLYADACLWDNNIASATYRECIGSDGKSGGTVVTRYTVKIISGVGTTQTLNTLLYDFSGSSFHYNSDFETGLRFATIASPLSLTKSFSPKAITTSGGTSTLTLAISNSSSTQINNVSVTDPLPSGMIVASTPNATPVSFPSGGCVSGTFSPTAGNTSLTFTGSIAGNSTCTLTVSVTASPDGSFTNTAELFLDSAVTGITSTDTLGVSTSSQTCGATQTLAKWTFPSSTLATSLVPDAGSVLSSSIARTLGTGSSSIDTNSNNTPGGTTYSWLMDGFRTRNAAFEFEIPNGSAYQNLAISVAYKQNNASWNSSSVVQISSANDNTSNYALVYSDNTFTSAFEVGGANSATTGTTRTYFRVLATNPQNDQAGMLIDDVTITGCAVSTLEKPRLSKSFSPDPITVGETSTLTFTLTNPNSSTNLTSVSFTDILPSGMTVASTPVASTTCTGATWSPTAGATSLGFSGGTIPMGAPGTCTAQVNVAVDSAAVFTNTSGFISSSEAGINTNPYNDAKPGQGQDTLTATIGPPQIVKSFSPNPIPVNGTSTITFTITNPNTDVNLTGVAFTDTFIAGLEIATVPNATTTCSGGILTSDGINPVTSGDTSFQLAGATVPMGASCLIQVDVSAISTGDKLNSVQVSSSNGGTGNTSTDTLGVNALTPAISLLKEISTSASGPWSSSVNIAAGSDVYYRFTIENTGDVNFSPVWVTDNKLSGTSACSWPATLPTASTGNPVATCVVGPVTAGSTSSTNTATAKGTYSGTTYTSAPSLATYDITDLALTKVVTPTVFTAGTTTLSYTYTITNNGSSPVSGTVTVDDTNAVVTCNSIASQGDLDANFDPGESLTCTASYTLTSRDRSIGYVTNIASGSIGSTKTNSTSATSVSDQPDLVVSKAADISGGQAIQGTPFTWTVTVANNGGGTATFANGATVLSDTLPSGATYSLPAPYSDLTGLTGNSGTLNCNIVSSTLTCVAATSSLIIESGRSFTVDVEITANVGTSTMTNVASADPNNVTTESNEGNNNGSDTVAASATLPNIRIIKSNDVGGGVVLGGSFTWTLTVENNGTSDITFADTQRVVSDALPSGPTYGTLNIIKTDVVNDVNLGCSISVSTLTCEASGGSITLPAARSFIVEIPVTPNSTGVLTNTAVVNPDFLFSEGSTADNSSTNSVTVYTPPTVTKSFSPATISAGGTSTLSLALTNPSSNPGALTTVRVDDDFGSSGITLDSTTFTFTPASCGTITKINGSASAVNDTAIRFTAASLAPGASCSVDVDVTSSTVGQVTNTTSAPTASGPFSLTGNTVNADLTVTGPDLSLRKDDGVTNVAAGGTTTYVLTVSNTGNASTSGTITVVDVLPSGMSVADGSLTLTGANNADWSCSSASDVVTCTSSIAIAATGDSVFAFTVNVDSAASGSQVNRAKVGGGGDPTNSSAPTSTTVNNCTADDTPEGCALDTDTVQVAPDLSLAKTDSLTTVSAGGTTTYSLTVSNTGSANTSGTITIVDVLPAGMSVADGSLTLTGTNNADWSCSSTSDVITCTSSIAIVSASDSVFAFTVDVDAAASGSQVNRAKVGGGGDPTNSSAPTATDVSNCTADNTPEGCALDTDTIQTTTDLSLTKTDSLTTVTAGGTTTYTLTVSNSGSGNTTGTITVVDVLPAGMSVADGSLTLTGTNSADWSCSSASDVVTCTSSVAIASASNSVFTFTVNVDVAASGSQVNRAKVGGGGDPTNPSAPTSTTVNNCTADDTPEGCALDTDAVQLGPDLGLTKTDSLTTVTAGGTTTYTLTVSNSGGGNTTGTINLVDVLPVGMSVTDGPLTLTGANSADWSCSSTSDVITCASSVVIPSSGDSVLAFTVNIDASATGSQVNRAKVGGGGDPTNSSAPTPTDVNACVATGTPEGCALDTNNMPNVFDPPLGIKSLDGDGNPILIFRMVWINDSNVVATNVQVVDDIPVGTTYVPNSLQCVPQGLSTTNAGSSSAPLNTALTSCAFDATANGGLGRIQWQGSIAPDPGATTEANASNEVIITFSVNVNSSTNQVNNTATSRTDTNGNGNFAEETIVGTQVVGSNSVTWTRSSSSLPKTGFAPNVVTNLPKQPVDLMYSEMENIQLLIPSLGVRTDIVGVPEVSGNWDVNWLGAKTGWMEGTAFPTWQGNSVLAGHSYLANGKKGPFADLSKLRWGDVLIIKAFGQQYVYEVRSNAIVDPNDKKPLKHEELSWLTLITCKEFDPDLNTYRYRVVVRAVLTKVK
ncbi:MAG: sortase [Anaerolineales bacterium]|nr:sortase [Anaerolineales bacterium]